MLTITRQKLISEEYSWNQHSAGWTTSWGIAVGRRRSTTTTNHAPHRTPTGC